MLNVAIADDHPVVRAGVSQILTQSGKIQITAEYSGVKELLQGIDKDDYSVLVLDINLKDGNGIELAQTLKAQKPNVHILILSIYPEEQYAIRAMKAGASGYLTKDSMPALLETAVLKLGKGQRFISDTLAELLANQALNGNQEDPIQTLSDREYQTLCLMASGKASGEIAAHLHISPKTVSTYRTRLLEKLNLSNNAELISFAIKRRLVD